MDTFEFEFADQYGNPQIGSVGAVDAEALWRRMNRGETLSFVERLAAEAYGRTRQGGQGVQRQAMSIAPGGISALPQGRSPGGFTVFPGRQGASSSDSGGRSGDDRISGGFFGSESSAGAGDVEITLQPTGSSFLVEDLLFSTDDTAATLQQVVFNNTKLFYGAASKKGPLLSDLKGDSLVRNWFRNQIRIDNTAPLIVTVKFSAASKFCSVTALGTPSNLSCAT